MIFDEFCLTYQKNKSNEAVEEDTLINLQCLIDILETKSMGDITSKLIPLRFDSFLFFLSSSILFFVPSENVFDLIDQALEKIITLETNTNFLILNTKWEKKVHSYKKLNR